MPMVRTALACLALAVLVLAASVDPLSRSGPDGGSQVPVANSGHGGNSLGTSKGPDLGGIGPHVGSTALSTRPGDDPDFGGQIPGLGPSSGGTVAGAPVLGRGPDFGGNIPGDDATDVVTLRVVSISRRGTGGLPVVVRDAARGVIAVMRTGRDGSLELEVPRNSCRVATLPTLDADLPLVAGSPVVVVVR